MSKLTKIRLKNHNIATDLLKKDILSDEDKEFVIENWKPYADHNISASATFFTPVDVCDELSIQVLSSLDPQKKYTILDLCAGIGNLSSSIVNNNRHDNTEIIAVEFNQDFIDVGKKLLPKVTWINYDAFDEDFWVKNDFTNNKVDFMICNPPFSLRHDWSGELQLRSELISYLICLKYSKFGGYFIVPQNCVPFEYSGRPYYSSSVSPVWNKVLKIYPKANCECLSVDMSIYTELWDNVTPNVELVFVYNE